MNAILTQIHHDYRLPLTGVESVVCPRCHNSTDKVVVLDKFNLHHFTAELNYRTSRREYFRVSLEVCQSCLVRH